MSISIGVLEMDLLVEIIRLLKSKGCSRKEINSIYGTFEHINKIEQKKLLDLFKNDNISTSHIQQILNESHQKSQEYIDLKNLSNIIK